MKLRFKKDLLDNKCDNTVTFITNVTALTLSNEILLHNICMTFKVYLTVSFYTRQI